MLVASNARSSAEHEAATSAGAGAAIEEGEVDMEDGEIGSDQAAKLIHQATRKADRRRRARARKRQRRQTATTSAPLPAGALHGGFPPADMLGHAYTPVMPGQGAGPATLMATPLNAPLLPFHHGAMHSGPAVHGGVGLPAHTTHHPGGAGPLLQRPPGPVGEHVGCCRGGWLLAACVTLVVPVCVLFSMPSSVNYGLSNSLLPSPPIHTDDELADAGGAHGRSLVAALVSRAGRDPEFFRRVTDALASRYVSTRSCTCSVACCFLLLLLPVLCCCLSPCSCCVHVAACQARHEFAISGGAGCTAVLPHWG